MPLRTAAAVATLCAVLLAGALASNSRSAPPPKPTIVLVHGAFADAGGWSGVVSRLQRAGYPVVAPANPLRGVAADAAYIKSVVASIRGPVVLVGHSYAGAVISNAATPSVKALVYLAAIAPDEGESQATILARFPPAKLGPATLIERPFPGGTDLYVKPEAFRDVFAADQSPANAAVMAASQRPLAKAATTGKSGPPAWKNLPSWYMVAANDHAINPDAERFMARRAHAHMVVADSSHDVVTSHPDEVAKLIVSADRATESR
jgi:pimeloyl-ACP methyl ester carboxylesterase